MEIKFNIFKPRLVKSGFECPVKELNQLYKFGSSSKEHSYIIQTFDDGYRVSSANIDYSKWNGTIFIDIDSKKFKINNELFFGTLNQKNQFVPDKAKSNTFKLFYESILQRLQADTDILLASQQSASEFSFHLIFYFDVERNEDNFKRAEIFALNEVRKAAYKLGSDAKAIIDFPGVLDTCTQSVGQGIYISDFEIKIFEPSGKAELDDILIETEEFTKTEVIFSNNTYKLSSKFTQLPDYQYNTRFKLCWIIYNYFNWDFERCKEVYSEIVKFIATNRTDYTLKELMWQFERDFKASKSKTYHFNAELVEWCKKNLGFKISVKKEFVPSDIAKLTYDKIYTLEEGQTVSTIINEIIKLNHNIIHVDSGCGDGKTYSAKWLSNSYKTSDDIESVFSNDFYNNLFGHRICFVTPMKSINKDNFEDIEGWEIVDSDHSGNFKDSSKNICTTWDSFFNRNMWEWNFDVVMIDEIHTMYMYDYRLTAISNLKRSIEILNNNNIKTILFTGTPSLETKEFDVYKVKIERKRTKVNADIVFYNESFSGYIFEDIKEWLVDPSHKVIVFNDNTNYKTEDQFISRGFEDIEVYNSNYIENVERISKEHSLKHRITLVSVYGQAGINLYADKNDRVRIYILSNNGLSIVQYANRLRNKETIDKVVIPYKLRNITNGVKLINMDTDFLYGEDKVNMINYNVKMINDDPLIKEYIEIIRQRFGLNPDCMDKNAYGMYALNMYKYRTDDLIKKVNKYESQINVIYNRLISNDFNVNNIYLDDDTKDYVKKYKRTDSFKNAILKLTNWDIFSDCLKLRKDSLKFDFSKYEINKVMGSNFDKTFTSVLNFMYKTNDFDIKNTHSSFCNFINERIMISKSIRKSDFIKLADALDIINKFDNLCDSIYIKMLLDEKWGFEKTVAYYIGTLKFDEKYFNDVIKESKTKFKKIYDAVKEYDYMFTNVNFNAMFVESDVNVAKRAYELLMHKTNRGNGKRKQIEIDGVVYNSINEAGRILKTSTRQVYKKIDKKLK